MDHIKTNQTSAIVRIKHLQTVLGHFKRDFMLNMYFSLREKHSHVKNKTLSQCYLKEGDVVLIKENNSTLRLSWKKGVIEKKFTKNSSTK